MVLQRYKLVFAGSMGAGKSTAIQTISSIDVLSTEGLCCTNLASKAYSAI